MNQSSPKSTASLLAVGGVTTRSGGLRLRRLALLLVGIGLAAVLAVGLVSRAQAGVSRHGPPALHVNPFPGTPDAASNSSIIFSSLTSTSQLRSLTVRGSRSGVHGGRLQMLPNHGGVAFVPGRPFAPGERVRVIARLSSPAAGTASGDPGATRLTFSFGVLVEPAASRSRSDPSPSAHASSSPPVKSFHSAPDLHPTVVDVSSDPDTSSGDIFISPDHTSQMGPMILNSQGQLVWFLPIDGGKASNFAVQTYQGKPVLTWWQGPNADNGKDGFDVIMNSSYQTVATVHAVGTGYSADLHDFQITPQGTAFINSVVAAKANLSSVGGPKNGYVWDNVIQEIDIATGKQLWSWHSYGHIPINATHKPPSGSYCDCYHLNSIQPLSDGDLLVSSRSTWSIYKISTKTGQILWTLGGKYNQFKRGTGVGWAWQHDARRIGNTLTMFDDGASPQEEQESAAKVFHLEVGKKTVTLVHRYYHSPPLLASAQGSAQLLPNGNMFVGWGTEPDFSEYTASGKQIMTGSFPLGETSYRAFRFPWSGQPTYPPSMAVTSASSSGSYDVWASWNGATNVAKWRVLFGPSSSGPFTGNTTASRYSFETEIPVAAPTGAQYVEVQALSSQGQVLPDGTSAAQSLG
jgi:hypothetical protein